MPAATRKTIRSCTRKYFFRFSPSGFFENSNLFGRPNRDTISNPNSGRSGRIYLFLSMFSTLKEGVAGGGGRLPSGKHRLPLPQEGVCPKTRAFRGFGPGGTAIAVPPPKAFDLSLVPPPKAFDLSLVPLPAQVCFFYTLL